MTGSIVNYEQGFELQHFLFEVILHVRNKALVEPFQEQDGVTQAFLRYQMTGRQFLFLCLRACRLCALQTRPWFDHVAYCVATQPQSKAIFPGLEPRGLLGAPVDVGMIGHLLPEQACFITIEDLLQKVAFLFYEFLELFWER